MNNYLTDLHIHTCLSPCASDEMVPPNILNMAKLMGLKILGICDHNSAKNVLAIQEAAKDYDILVLAGIEVQSIEEVHILCYFDDIGTCLKFQARVYESLPKTDNRPDIFGHQWIVDKGGHIIGEEKQLLLTSTNMTIDTIRKEVMNLGGLYVPAHIDRRSFSLYGQLGFLSDNLAPDALEFSRNASKESVRKDFNIDDDYTLITSSDAHNLIDMAYQRMYLYIDSLNFLEVKMALEGSGGRRVVIEE